MILVLKCDDRENLVGIFRYLLFPLNVRKPLDEHNGVRTFDTTPAQTNKYIYRSAALYSTQFIKVFFSCSFAR